MTSRPSVFSQSVIDQASAWVIRLSGDAVGPEDYLGLEAWLAEAPEHRPAFDAAEGLWAALSDDRSALDAALTRSVADLGLSSASVSSNRRRTPQRRRSWAAVGLAVAAAVTLAIVVGPVLGARAVVYETAPGEQKTVNLADGSTLEMNGASRVTVRLSSGERLVEMGAAEVAFDVAHDARRPFRVTAGESRIEVLGTAFDVRRNAGATRVSVSRGVVRVSDLARAANAVRLTAGQVASRSDRDGRLEVTTEPVAFAGWKTRRLVYDHRPLSEVAEDLSRVYATPVRAVGGAERLVFTGVVTLDDQASTLRRLEAFLPVSTAQVSGAVELRPR